jgi:hypothetical protein
VIKVPEFKEPGLTDFLARVEAERNRDLRNLLSAVTGNRSVLLLSPSRKTYEIKVNDAGVISATLVLG